MNISNERTEILPKNLFLSVRYQARKTPGQKPLAELADTIAAQGLLQNLVVVKAKKKSQYEVVAGGRRWAAIQILIEDGRWPHDRAVPVLIIEEKHGLEASLTENIGREDMEPVDEFEAFAQLIDQGNTIEDIAARFGRNPGYVRGRMKLAAVAPDLLQAFRNKEMPLSVLMAFTISDDHARQLEVWAGMGAWDRMNTRPKSIRSKLTDNALSADRGIAKFVGLDAYEAAGGRVVRDLFADDSDLSGIYLQDAEIIKTLALEKMQINLSQHSEGWAWVETVLTWDEAGWVGHSNKFGRVHAEERKLTKAETAQIKALTAQIDALDTAMDALEDPNGIDEEAWDKMNDEMSDLSDQLDAIKNSARDWSDEAKKFSGIGAYISDTGELNITYGLIRPEDRRAAQVAAQTAANEGGDSPALRTSLPAPTTRPAYSERLMRQLTAHKVGAVSADLASKPAIALAVLVAQLTQEKLGPGWARGFGLGISMRNEALRTHAPDYDDSKAANAQDQMRQHWLGILPTKDGQVTPEVLPWALAQDQQILLDLLAYCIAGTVQGIQTQDTKHATPLDALATTAETDIADWWAPTGESFLAHVSKGMITQVVTEGVGADAALALGAMKKGAAVEAAEKALAGSRWLPEPMRIKLASQAE